MDCPSFTQLILFLQNREAGGAPPTIYAHLIRKCPICLKKVEWVERVLADTVKYQLFKKLSIENLDWLEKILITASEDQSFEFSAEAIAAIIVKFREQTTTGLRPVRQYIAKLMYDSGLVPSPPQYAGARVPSKKHPRRQSLYHAQGYDIDLLFVVSRENNNERLIGQILPERWDTTGPKRFKVQLLQQGSVISVTNTNDTGQFKFAKLMSGTYDLKVSVPDGEINLERVQTARSI